MFVQTCFFHILHQIIVCIALVYVVLMFAQHLYRSSQWISCIYVMCGKINTIHISQQPLGAECVFYYTSFFPVFIDLSKITPFLQILSFIQCSTQFWLHIGETWHIEYVHLTTGIEIYKYNFSATHVDVLFCDLFVSEICEVMPIQFNSSPVLTWSSKKNALICDVGYCLPHIVTYVQSSFQLAFP